MIILPEMGSSYIYRARVSEDASDITGWGENIRQIEYLSSADNTAQPAQFYCPNKDKPTPLLVGLHNWSSGYRESELGAPYAHWCVEKGWAFIYPDFRGPNNRPEATGSELAVRDVICAVDYAKANANVDVSRIYLAGVSGGGYATLLMAGRAPEIWAGASAWVPISDLKAWYYECKKNNLGYYKQIAESCGGEPIEGSAAAEQCRKRSAITYLANAKNVPLDINAGIHDGYAGSVYISHSLNAFNALAAKADNISQEQIEYFVTKQEVPPELISEISDPLYGDKKVLFRRESGNTRITIFQGGHEILYLPCLSWLADKFKK